MALPEDAASVLEQFVHDVANTPAEITHLLEEIQAKDLQILAFKDEINKRDNQLQKWVRMNGGHVLNPKEEAFSKTINDCYDKCEMLQAEKCGLSEKALIVLERQIKRLDVNLRGLAMKEEFPSDWGGPSLLSGSVTGVSTPVTTGPLRDASGNIGTTGGAPNIANAAQIRMAQQAAVAGARGGSGQQTPTANMARGQRESSTDANKRRRLNATLGTLPTTGSNLRQSSLGPGTPKAGTPNPATAAVRDSSRAASAQPSQRAGAGQKKAPQPGRKAPPAQAAGRKRVRTTNKKGDRRRQLTRDRATPSTNASASGDDSDSASPTPSSLPRSQNDGTTDRPSRRKPVAVDEPEASGDDEEEEENDETLYCYCQKVSFGDMVGCDNDECRFQWFHWSCVGLKSEPAGEWLCPDCRKLGRGQIVISKA